MRIQGFTALEIFELIERSGKNGITAKEIYSQLKLSQQNASQHLIRLEAEGKIKVEFDSEGREIKRNGSNVYKVNKNFRKNNTFPKRIFEKDYFSLSEIAILYLASTGGNIFTDREIEDTLESSREKLKLLFPQSLFDYLERFSNLFIAVNKFNKIPANEEQKYIDDLFDAMLNNKRCCVRYHAFSTDLIKQYDIDPLYFFEFDGGLYIFARAVDHDNIIKLAVERIKKLEVSEQTFEYPEHFNPKKELEKAFALKNQDSFKAKIWISEEMSRYVEERLQNIPGYLDVEKLESGAIIIYLETSGQSSLIHWVLGFGRNAEILEPKSLRKKIAKQLKASLKKYEK